MSNDQILNELLGTPVQVVDTVVDLSTLTPLENVDELVVIVDRSGSMRSLKADAEGGINTFIEEQKETGEANITLTEFDNVADEVYPRIPIKNAPEYVLHPRGGTALFDAIGMTLGQYRNIQTTGKQIAVIVTDGDENASKEWTEEGVKQLIEDLREENWEFVFLAADEAALRGSTKWGMDIDTSMVFDRTEVGAQNAAYSAASTYSTSLRSGKSRGASIADMDDSIKGLTSVKKLSS